MKPPSTDALILSVDDNDASRYAIARTLEQVGFRVVEAATGDEGLRRARTDAPDLILLDVKLPDIDGFEVSRLLKADPVTASIPVLQMTATYGSKENWAAALDAGADAYLTHPAEPIVLVATIRALLRAREAERALREANRLKDDFLATLSHELRTPLNAIVGLGARAAHARTWIRPSMARAMESIQRNAEAQTRLVADILDVSRIVTGKLRIDSRRVDLGKVVEAALETVRPSTVGRQITVELVGACRRRRRARRRQPPAADRLEPAHQRGEVHADGRPGAGRAPPQPFERRAGRGGHGHGHRSRLPAPRLRPVPAGGRLHDALRRRPGPRPRPRARPRAHARGHRARGEPGQGPGIALHRRPPCRWPLPCAARAPGPAASRRSWSPPVAPLRPRGGHGGIRVLVVDDDADFLESLEVALRERGAVVKTATSVPSRPHRLETWRPDVLISDLGMPEEDGLRPHPRRRARPAAGGLPAIALTAYAADHDRERSLAAGYQRHVGKPADPTAIIEAIADLADLAPRGARG